MDVVFDCEHSSISLYSIVYNLSIIEGGDCKIGLIVDYQCSIALITETIVS